MLFVYLSHKMQSTTLPEIEVSASGNISDNVDCLDNQSIREDFKDIEDAEDLESVESAESLEAAESVKNAENSADNLNANNKHKRVNFAKSSNDSRPIIHDIDYSMCILNTYDLDILLDNIRDIISEKRELGHVNSNKFSIVERYIYAAIENNETAFWDHINVYNIANSESNIVTSKNVDCGIQEYTESTFVKSIIYCGYNMYYYALDLFRLSNSPFDRFTEFCNSLHHAVDNVSESDMTQAEYNKTIMILFVSMLKAALFYPETIPARFTALSKLNISEFKLADATMYSETRKLLAMLDRLHLPKGVVYTYISDNVEVYREINHHKLVINKSFIKLDDRDTLFDVSTPLITGVFDNIPAGDVDTRDMTYELFDIYNPLRTFNYQKKICARSEQINELKKVVDSRNTSINSNRSMKKHDTASRDDNRSNALDGLNESDESNELDKSEVSASEPIQQEDIFMNPNIQHDNIAFDDSEKLSVATPSVNTLIMSHLRARSNSESNSESDSDSDKDGDIKIRYNPTLTATIDTQRKSMVKYKQNTSQQNYRETIFNNYARGIRTIQRANPHYVLMKLADKACIESGYKYKYLKIYRKLNTEISEEFAYKFLIAIASNIYTYFLIFTPEFLEVINQTNYSYKCSPRFEYVIYYANIIANYYEVMGFLKARFGSGDSENVIRDNYTGMLSNKDIGSYCSKHMIKHDFDIDASLLINLTNKKHKMINLMISERLSSSIYNEDLKSTEFVDNIPKSIVYNQTTSANIYEADIVKLRLLFLSKGIIDSEFDWFGVNLTGSSFMLAAYDTNTRLSLYRADFTNKFPAEFNELFEKHEELLSYDYTIEKFIYNKAVRLPIDMKSNIRNLIKHAVKYYQTDKHVAPDALLIKNYYRQGEMTLDMLDKVPESWIDFDFVVDTFSELERTAHRIFEHFLKKCPEMYIMIQVSSRRYIIVPKVNYLPSADVYYHTISKVMAYHVAGVRGYFNGSESMFAPSCFNFIHTNINETTRAVTTISSYTIVDKYTDRGVIFVTDVSRIRSAICTVLTEALFSEDNITNMSERNKLLDTIMSI